MEKNTAIIDNKTLVLLKAPTFTERGDIYTTYNEVTMMVFILLYLYIYMYLVNWQNN